MSKRAPKRTPAAKPHTSRVPLWRQVVATLCLFIFTLASSAQAVHTHGEWLAKNEVQAHTPSATTSTVAGDDHCPLCVAMHSAKPARLLSPRGPALVSHAKLPESPAAMPAGRWHFAMFSRPPPAAAGF